jgi:hypothetical protein
MASEFDHLFACVSAGAPEADRLVEFGLTEGSRNAHPGQGTANRRFFFHNAMLELLWVQDAAEAQSELVRPTRLWERWAGRASGACPLALCFRPKSQQPGEPPFPMWEYHPPYLPETQSFGIATNADILTEPMLCYLAFGQRPDNYPAEKRQPMEHGAGLCEITRVELVIPHAGAPSPELRAVMRASLVGLRSGAMYLVELGFDGEVKGRKADFQPALPLIFFW